MGHWVHRSSGLGDCAERRRQRLQIFVAADPLDPSRLPRARFETREKSSSPISGDDAPDLEEEAGVLAEAAGHSLDDDGPAIAPVGVQLVGTIGAHPVDDLAAVPGDDAEQIEAGRRPAVLICGSNRLVMTLLGSLANPANRRRAERRDRPREEAVPQLLDQRYFVEFSAFTRPAP